MVERGLAESRARALRLIEAGMVRQGDEILLRASRLFDANAAIDVTQPVENWVSRGALKLLEALDRFAIDPAGSVALDIGAATGGFTEVLLARGAARVHAVDVGHDQMAQKLRADPRVLLREGLNARYLTYADIGEPVDLAVCDASFIDLRTLLPASLALVAPGGFLIALIKPQFEVGKARIGNGIVRDSALHEEVCRDIESWLESLPGWQVLGIVPSPIAGGEGNLEFLIAARRGGEASA